MFYVCLFLVLAVVVGTFISIAQTNKRKAAMSSQLDTLSGFTPSQRFMGVDGLTGLAIDEKRELLCLISGSQHGDTLRTRTVPYADIVSVEITEDGDSITKTSRSSQLGGAVVGGVLLGGVGAVVGGLSGKTKTTQKIKRVDLRIVVDDTTAPLHNVCFQDAPGDRGGLIHKDASSKARHWNGLLDVVIRRADQVRAQAVNMAQKPRESATLTSAADELKKLADLKADGILTEEEFQAEKRKVLSRAI